jgi:hypothetical protein
VSDPALVSERGESTDGRHFLRCNANGRLVARGGGARHRSGGRCTGGVAAWLAAGGAGGTEGAVAAELAQLRKVRETVFINPLCSPLPRGCQRCSTPTVPQYGCGWR